MGDNCRLGTERLLGSVMYVLVKNQLHILLQKLHWEAHLLFSLNYLEFSNTSKIYNLKRILCLLFPLKVLIRCNLDPAPKFLLM